MLKESKVLKGFQENIFKGQVTGGVALQAM